MALHALFRASGYPSGWAAMMCNVSGLAHLVCRQDVLQLGAVLLPQAHTAKLAACICHSKVQRRDLHRQDHLQYQRMGPLSCEHGQHVQSKPASPLQLLTDSDPSLR